MSKRRIVLVVDETRFYLESNLRDHVSGCTVESVEDIPEPLTQRFTVEIEHDDYCPLATEAAMVSKAIKKQLDGNGFSHKVTVTEVEPTT